MTLVDRTYPDIVRDVLTTLTNGVAGEVQPVPDYDPSARPVTVPDIVLLRRPVRRVSLVAGFVEAPKPTDDPVPYVFRLSDYELVPSDDDPRDLSTIRFLPFGRKPAPGTSLVVNYYPRNVEPAPIDDVNVGSVTRTLVEALGRELATVYAALNLAYDSAYVDTAEGLSLDRVVALLGLKRYRAGRPVGTARFGRRAGAVGTISIPPGTPITDPEDKIRYETVDPHTMLAGESTAEIRIRGASDATPPVEAGVLTVVPRAIAGIEGAINERGTSPASRDEADDELRPRARAALASAAKGTISGLVNGLLQMPEVRAVNVQEFPNGVPGEIRVSISLTSGGATLPRAIEDRIEELRPAGIRVVGETAARVDLTARVQLTLAGSHRTPSEVEAIHGSVRRTLAAQMEKTGVGQLVRSAPLVGALLADERIVDAKLTLGDSAPGTDFQPPAAAIAELEEAQITFEPDRYDQALPADGAEIVVEVDATVAGQPNPSVPVTEVQAQIEARLRDYFAALTAPAEIDAATLLTTLRDDTRYALDPLRLQVILTAGDQFVTIAQGAAAFTVLPGHTFNVTAVHVTVSGGST